MANTFKFGNGNWAVKDGYALAYNDENNNFKPLPFDFTRASSATRVNKQGLIETVGSGKPRIDFLDNTSGHLLLEPSRTNLVTDSEDFTQWANTGSETTDTADSAISPDGSLNATKLQEANSNFGYHRLSKTITASSATDYALSIFVKKGTQKYIQLLLLSTSNSFAASKVFDLENGTLGETIINGTATLTDAKIEDFGNGWYRCTIIAQLSTAPNTFRVNLANAATGNTKSLGMVQYTGDGNGNIYIWGAQLEAGSYATSYIPTSGSSVTRTEDFCYINSGLQDTLNTSEGTLFVDVEVPRVSSTGSFERIVLSDQNASTDRILFDNYGGQWRIITVSSAGVYYSYRGNVQAGQRVKFAFAYTGTQIRSSKNGGSVNVATAPYTPSTTLESFKFSNKDGGNKWQGKIYEVKYFDTVLSDSELIALTS